MRAWYHNNNNHCEDDINDQQFHLNAVQYICFDDRYNPNNVDHFYNLFIRNINIDNSHIHGQHDYHLHFSHIFYLGNNQLHRDSDKYAYSIHVDHEHHTHRHSHNHLY
mmetsp:Transcript_56579/g.132196  ORF Transcript_56579/g.132196 Transcript_56579/m.132196 type:complete len:108 (+) Transcript_56579:623-946(+)